MEAKNIADYIKVDTLNLNLESKNKNAVIRELYNNLKKTNLIKNEEQGLNDIFAREEMGSTGIGKKIALPHAKTKAVDELMITFGISRNGIAYNSIDDENVNIFFMFLCPENKTQEYLKVLARISRLIREDRFVESLLKATTNEEVLEIIRSEEIRG
ncbi:PTS transporter subunit IIA-like nitrogen-regulatory protein PtsN [Leptotrichia trevisanii]|uniref:PTS transporter subunit IIA-like nitrogen-regulatory protein PtsN n=1 Tax=Leptotrichia trevisanii TaxID=109328 RepID=A0A510L0I5_9FUSO|nr:PTS sugar transporter subunit IIA [Leptotrichia trevisanii]BBM52689.1 PTS transporter subunit IIA-like nitrogen-regulatory protein PtsN [Leptotrichia trevisanii]BBM57490.1 PTS transporter subunit IIA-like nitrogen-regulatory protein PtsN [Leptotrichia trevisanii]